MKKYRSYGITPIPFSCGPIGSENSLFPTPLRCLIIGSSGSGKTTLLWNIITKNWISYKYLYIFSKSIEQPVYIKLKEIYKKIENEIGQEISYFYSNCEDIISVDECEPNSLIIFDDCILEKQGPIKEYFVRGRHKNISAIYLSQCFSMVDLKTIRNNLNFLCIFKQNEHYTKTIFDNFVVSDMSFNDFKTTCYRCWNNEFGFLSIDLTKKMDDGRFMKNFSLLNG